MIIYLTRHAEFLARKGLSDREKSGIGLSDFGKLQANAMSKALKKLGIEKIYSSPIARARETAEIISSCTGIPVEYDERLKEFSADFNSTDLVEQKELKKKARESPDQKVGDESLNTAIERLMNTVKDISQLQHNSVCVVTHRVILEGFLAKFFNIKPNKHEWLRSASITALEFGKEKGALLLYFDYRALDSRLFLEIIKRRVQEIFGCLN